MPQRGIPLALVTNDDASQQRYKIARHDRARFFDAIVVEGKFGTGKPDKAVYRHALGALGMAPGEALMVGDHLEWDVGGASAARAHRRVDGPRWARLPHGSAVQPHRIIHSLDELTASGS